MILALNEIFAQLKTIHRQFIVASPVCDIPLLFSALSRSRIGQRSLTADVSEPHPKGGIS
jgi:hypothetical protein